MKIVVVFFRTFLFSEQNYILIKNRRQLSHKGNHFRTIGEGIKSIRLYMLEKYSAQNIHFATKIRSFLAWFSKGSLVLALNEGQF